MKRSILLAAAMAIVSATPTEAATYVFNVDYLGAGVAVSRVGSPDPTTVSLNVGDSFTYTLSAPNNGFWTADSDINYFAALFVLPGATRVHSFDYAVLNDGVASSWGSDPSIGSSTVHIGKLVAIASGTVFDQVVFGATLTQVIGTDSSSAISQLLPFSGAPDNNPSVSFTAGAIPEPATWAMMLMGFGMIGAATRYRRRGMTIVYG